MLRYKRTFGNGSKLYKDEYYTTEETVKQLIDPVLDYLKDKTVYCPCDDYRISNFVKYLQGKCKHLIATNLDIGEGSYIYKDGKVEANTNNGDFRLQPYYDEADVIITNPPFSIFSDFYKK